MTSQETSYIDLNNQDISGEGISGEGISGEGILQGDDFLFSISLNKYTLDINYFFEYNDIYNKYNKVLDIEVKKNNILTNIDHLYLILPDFENNKIFENNEYDISFTDISKVRIDMYESEYLNNIALKPGRWGAAISDEDIDLNILDKKYFYIPYRDFLYNNKQLDFSRDEIEKKKLILSINKEELFRLRNNNKKYYNFLGKQINNLNKSFLKTFFNVVIWFPEDEKTLGGTWELPENYQGKSDPRIYTTPTYYEKNSNIDFYENLSSFKEPGFRFSDNSLSKNLFFSNSVAKIELLDTNDNSIVINEYNTISEHYYLLQRNINNTFNNLKFKSLDSNFQNINNWVAEIFIPEDVNLKNNFEVTQENLLEENFIPTKLIDCSGVYSYSILGDSDNNMALGIKGAGNLVIGKDDEETNENKKKSYIFKDKNGVLYHANLNDYRITYNNISDSYIGGFYIKYIFRERKEGLNIYIDVFIFINNIFHTKILDGGDKLNNINYWGYYGDKQENMIYSLTNIYQSLNNEAYIDDVYDIKDITYWNKYVPVLNSSILLSDFRTDDSNTVYLNTEYPVYLTYDGEETDENSSEYFSLILDIGDDQKIYMEVEDFKFIYRIDDVTSDKFSIELSNDLTNWEIPGIDIEGIEWLNKTMIRNSITSLIINDTVSVKEYSGTLPIKLSNRQSGKNNYDIRQNENYIVDTGDTKLKNIIFKKISLGLNQKNNMGYDTLKIFYSDDKETWETPEIDWLYKEEINIGSAIPVGIVALDDITEKTSGDNPYGYNNLFERYPVSFISNSGLSGNYQHNKNYEYYFDAGEGEKISFLITILSIQNSNDKFTIFGTNTAIPGNNDTVTFEWTPLQVSFFKNSENYKLRSAEFPGNFITFSKVILNLSFGKTQRDLNDDIILNTGYRFIKFVFASSNLDNNPNWDFKIYKTSQFIKLNGNVIPSSIEEPNDKIIAFNKRYIKLSFSSDDLYTDYGFDMEIYKKDDYTNYKNGNIFPETISVAEKIYNVSNFFEFNKLSFNYKYIKFKYNRKNSSIYNDINRWKIRIDNKPKIYNTIFFNIENYESTIFKENAFLDNYPVKFKPNEQNLYYDTAFKYEYIFDAGENNKISMQFNSFDISHNTDIDGLLRTNKESRKLEKDGFLLINNKLTFSYSNDNIKWFPAQVPWMHKTDSFKGNTVGGRRVANYDFFYDDQNILKTTANIVSWFNDTNGFMLPSNHEKAKEIYCYNNDIVDISWNKINKVYSNYRYVKIILFFETEEDKYNNVNWDIDFFINNNDGFDNGIISNFNSINIFENKNMISSLDFEVSNTEVNLDTFESTFRFVSNGNEIPYIAKYDYILKDMSNNIVLKSQIDTDVYHDIFNINSNYNSNRQGIEYLLLKNKLADENTMVNFEQKYYYTSKFFSDRLTTTNVYIPEKGDYKFFTVDKRMNLNISDDLINKIKENIIFFWRGNDYPTYVNLVLYIWYPWSEKYKKYTNSIESVSEDLKYSLTDELCDEVIKIKIEDGVFYTNNIVATPAERNFNYFINQYSGRYIFSWSYEVHQKNGLFDNYTPAKYYYDFDYFGMYTPQFEILNVTDFITDDFLYDPQEPILTYIPDYTDVDQDISYNKIEISLSDTEIEEFNNFIITHIKSLNSLNCDILNIEFSFYVLTPNNENSTNLDGWELPSDYYGVNDPRTLQTPYYYDNKPISLTNDIWDPKYTDVSGNLKFGYNLDSSGVIVKKFSFSDKISFTKSDLTFDISYDSLFFPENDVYTVDYSNNKDIPNPYFYKKNNIFGVPYLCRWQYSIEEEITFRDSSLVSEADILLGSTYDVGDNLQENIYTGSYPINFFDDGGKNSNYSLGKQRVIIFDGGIDKTLSMEVKSFQFNHVINNLNNIQLKDRLAVLVSNDNITYEPLSLSWMYRSNTYGGDNSGNITTESYLTSLPGFIFPSTKNIGQRLINKNIENYSDISFNAYKLVDFQKRFVKFRFISSENSIAKNGWEIKIFNSNNKTNIISSNVIYQEGGLGNISSDFNYKFKIDSNIYLELDKQILLENIGILDYKDLIEGVSLAYVKGYNFYITNINNVIWQFVIKKPPIGYIFDELNENGEKIGNTQPVTNNNSVITSNSIDVTYNNDINDNTKISEINMSFEESLNSNFIDGGRKYILYIRKATNLEKNYFSKFGKGRITQILSNEVRSRISDWYPFKSRFKFSNNYYKYGKLFQTKYIEIQYDVEEDNDVSIMIDPCNLCRTTTDTKEQNNSKLRYANAVNINFNAAARLRSTICN